MNAWRLEIILMGMKYWIATDNFQDSTIVML